MRKNIKIWRFICSQQIDKVVSLHYHGLMGKIKEHEGKKYLMVNDHMLDKVLDKIKEKVGIVKLDDSRDFDWYSW